MEYQLDIRERLLLSEALSTATVGLMELKLVRILREELGLTEEERKEIEWIQEDSGNVRWKMANDPHKKFEIGDGTLGIIKRSLIKMDEEKRLTVNHEKLWEIFVGVI